MGQVHPVELCRQAEAYNLWSKIIIPVVDAVHEENSTHHKHEVVHQLSHVALLQPREQDVPLFVKPRFSHSNDMHKL